MNYPGHVPMDTNGHMTPQQNNFMAGKHDRLANDSTFKTIAFWSTKKIDESGSDFCIGN